jgi:hypothetical protein
MKLLLWCWKPQERLMTPLDESDNENYAQKGVSICVYLHSTIVIVISKCIEAFEV